MIGNLTGSFAFRHIRQTKWQWNPTTQDILEKLQKKGRIKSLNQNS